MSNGTPSPLAIPAPGTSVPSGSLVTPSGSIGPVGPTAVSTDAGNIAQLGSDNLILVPQSQLWAMRLRSFNAVGNPNFEVDQRNAGGANTVKNTWALDRWYTSAVFSSAPPTWTVQQVAPPTPPIVPGTTFRPTSSVLSITVNTQKTSYFSSDYFTFMQNIEGMAARELYDSVSSLSILAYCTQPLHFACALSDSTGTANTLVNDCVITTANVWTLITLPNIPSMSSGGIAANLTPGVIAYQLYITLAVGTTKTAPPAYLNQWGLSGGKWGTQTQDQFFAKPVGTVLYLAAVQHEPGQCTTLIDKPFTQNYDECLRYFQKTYPYSTIPGSAVTLGQYAYWTTNPVASQLLPVRFIKPMAKAPTVAAYSVSSGAINTVRDYTAAVDRAVGAYFNVGDAGFAGFGLSTTPAANANIQFHYTADTGW